MTTLKEIERQYADTAIPNEHFAKHILLLIKAVRQLGVILSEYREVYPSMELRLDPEVLALIEEQE